MKSFQLLSALLSLNKKKNLFTNNDGNEPEPNPAHRTHNLFKPLCKFKVKLPEFFFLLLKYFVI